MPTPLSTVNDKFGSKDKLVDQIVTLLSKDSDEPKDDLRKRLLSVANKKLLHLHGLATTVSDKFGSKEKLVTATAESRKAPKDKDYVAKLGRLSVAQLLDIKRVADKRAKA